MTIHHETLADIPLIIEFCKRIGLQNIIDNTIGTHPNQKGLSNGQLVLGWIAHILTQNNHCKSPVQEWARKHKFTLQTLLEIKRLDTAFEDCQLSRLIERFADDRLWHGLEEAFYKDSFSILNLNIDAPCSFKENISSEDGISKTIKIDSTTAYGYHTVVDDGIMQRGWSKDHRSDLPQLKIMVSVEGKTGVQIASDILPGNKSDDPLYIPILERTRKIVDTLNSLICGDSKMSALYTRANIVKNNEFYLLPLQLSNDTKKIFNDLVDKIVVFDNPANLIFDGNDADAKLIGAGYEIDRNQSFATTNEIECDKLEWKERVFVIKSFDHAGQEIKVLNIKLKNTQHKLVNLKSKQCKSEDESKSEILNSIEKFKKENELSYAFNFEVKIEVEEKERKRTETRNGKIRGGSYTTTKYRAIITNVSQDDDKINILKYKLGWRLYVTNAKKEILSFSSAYLFFRKTMYVIEIGFHVLKDYINISPLFVRNQNQIIGMTRLLMLALKILTLMTAEVRANMQKENVILKGIYAGQAARKHVAPTAQSLLEYFSRQGIALIGHKIGENWHWEITPLTDTCRNILRLLRIPEDCYKAIAECQPKQFF